MAISLNNHETRIKALENGGSSTWTKGSNSNGNWVKESKTGLLIQWGVTPNVSQNNYLQVFPLAFSTITPVVVKSISSGYKQTWAPSWMSIINITLKSFTYKDIHTTYTGQNSWIAIGYLISNRILKYAYACKYLLFTPLRTIGGVK